MNVGRNRFLVLPSKNLTCAAICLLTVLAGCDLPDEPAIVASLGSEEAARLPVNASRISLTEDVYQSHLLYGLVRPRRSTSLGFIRGGEIAEIFFDVGQRVPDGEKVAELQQEDLVAQQVQLEETLNTRRDQLAEFSRRNNVQQMARLRSEITTLEAQQDELTRSVEQGIIFAPYEGILAQRDADESDIVPGGRPFCRIVEDTPPLIDVNVNLQLAKTLEAGSPAWVRRGNTLESAQVATKSPELDASSRTQRVSLELSDENTAGDWVYGETVEVHFWTPTTKSGFWVPHSALQRAANGLWAVYAVKNENGDQYADRTIVEVAQLEDQHALVRGTLNDGDLLIIGGLNRIVPGQRVRSTIVTTSFSAPGPPGAGE